MNKKFRVALIALMIAAAAMAFSGCGGSGSTGGDNAPADDSKTTEQAVTEESGSDLDYVKEKGAFIIGITIFDPMNYYDGDKLVGFDTEFAEAVCEKLGLKPEFVEINWDTKEIELQAKKIDCIWNGFTVREDLKDKLLFSNSYMKNMQVPVIRAKDADKFKTFEDMVKAAVVAEQGSAGETAVTATDSALHDATYTAMPKQTDALMEVKAGTADVAVLDYTLAKSMVGEGTNYSDLMMAPGLELNAEEYAIGFRLGSDIAPEVNKAMAELIADGTLDEIAEKYKLTASLLSNQ